MRKQRHRKKDEPKRQLQSITVWKKQFRVNNTNAYTQVQSKFRIHTMKTIFHYFEM